MAKILIVDDEPRIRELIEEHLEHEGYQCTQASDGAAALAAVAAGGSASVAVGAARIAGGAVSYDEAVDLSAYDSALASARGR